MKSLQALFDLSKLKKGDYIEAESLEKALEHTRDESVYGLKIMALIQTMNEFFRSNGQHVLSVQEKYGIRLLEDNDASSYCQTSFNRAEKKMDRIVEFQREIPTESLTSEELSRHLRNIEVNSRKMQMLAMAQNNSIEAMVKLIGDSTKKT